MENTIWKKTKNAITVRVISSSKWHVGNPKNPNIPKYLVHISFCPTDQQLPLLEELFDIHTVAIIKQAFHIKESHNRANLKNPEDRAIEAQLGCRD